MRNTIALLALMVSFCYPLAAQELLGVVTDNKKEPLVNASVTVTQGGITKGGTVTDFDGRYSIKPLDAGYYDVTVAYIGLKTSTVTKVVISDGQKTGLNFVLEPSSNRTTMKEVMVKAYKKPLVDKYKHSSIKTSEEIKRMPTTQTYDIVSQVPGMYQVPHGKGVNSNGGRSTANLYVIDGVQV